MSNGGNKTLIRSLVASILALCGCGQPAPPRDQGAIGPTVIEEISVSGFDPEGEPVIKKW